MLWNQVRDIMILILVVAMGASAGIGKKFFACEACSFERKINEAWNR
jgi:hypothetical protein